MCSVSMVGDFYSDQFRQRPYLNPIINTLPYQTLGNLLPQITRQEFDDLKRQVLEMKELLKRAKEYDERNGEPDCEIEEKMEILRKVAKLVGVDLSAVIGAGKQASI